MSRENVQGLHEFGTKPAADLKADNNEPATPCTLELLPTFDAACAGLRPTRRYRAGRLRAGGGSPRKVSEHPMVASGARATKEGR